MHLGHDRLDGLFLHTQDLEVFAETLYFLGGSVVFQVGHILDDLEPVDLLVI